jgi:hypothetical protein
MGKLVDLLQSLLRRLPVGTYRLAPELYLVIQARHANLKQLIHVAAKNTAEQQTIQQRVIVIHRLL